MHGLSNAFLADKPLFSAIADEFVAFVRGAELVIHNAPFDIGFLNAELALLKRGMGPMSEYCTVLDTLVMAKSMHPGQRNSLDALAKRYGADQRDRSYHGALLDSEILAEVYLGMTGGQVGLALSADDERQASGAATVKAIRRVPLGRAPLPVLAATADDLARHEKHLDELDKAVKGSCLWRQLSAPASGAEKVPAQE